MIYGATPDEWTHFDLILGLTADLLPVVSNPHAEPCETSKIKEPGKLPSRYNSSGKMVGFHQWTKHQATGKDIAKWSNNPDYGICLQTRHVRAIDVDINDFEQAFDVEGAIIEHLGFTPPARRRSNSSKFLMPVIVEGDLTKRRFKTGEKDAIEFLALGQQFIAVGTHPSGVKYEWTGGLPNEIPVLDIAEFEALWSMLHAKFGIDQSVTVRKGITPEKKRMLADANDPMVAYLEANWTVFDVNKDGRVDIECPFKDGHTDGISEGSSTSYYPAGVGGFEQGHFKCLHASCAHRTDQDFKNAIGYNAEGFEVIEYTPPPATAGDAPDTAAIERAQMDSFRRGIRQESRDPKTGIIKVTKDTLGVALAHPVICGATVRFDRFFETLMIAHRPDEWRPFEDEDFYHIARHLETRETNTYGAIPMELIKVAVKAIGKQEQFDTAQLWLDGLTWDGVPRCEDFLHKYFKTEDTAYIRAVSKYLWSALAGRVITPGVKADMVPLAVGDQGARKTSAVAAIAPHSSFHGELDLSKKDDDLARDIRGKLIMEIGELKGINKRDIEHLKSFISRLEEKWVKKYCEYQSTYPRRCVFFATSNDEESLPQDDTGNRRWLPFHAGLNGQKCDVDGIEAARDQLWAEAAVLYRKHGVIWEEAEVLAAEHLGSFQVEDPWVHRIREWAFEDDGMDGPPPAANPLHIYDVAQAALAIQVKDLKPHEVKRIAGILRKLGFVKRVKNGRKAWIARTTTE